MHKRREREREREEAHPEFVKHFGREVCGWYFASRSHDHNQLDASKGALHYKHLYSTEKKQTIASTYLQVQISGDAARTLFQRLGDSVLGYIEH